MKKIYLLITVFCVSTLPAFSQWVLYSANIDFETNSNLVEIDTSQAENVWQIGIPQKTYLDSAYSAPLGIITDTINNYPINNISSFQIKIIASPYYYCWGYGWIDFKHKYDFEQNKDGGYIEVQYDNDTNWVNIINDQEPSVWFDANNFYTNNDTIIGNIPAFTSTSNGWTYSHVEWMWDALVKSGMHDSLTIRFTIKSDSVETNQEGWLIDNIILYLEECTGNINESQIENDNSFIYPNPTTGIITIENSEYSIQNVSVFDIYGREIMKSEDVTLRDSKCELDLSQQPKGVYLIKLNTEEGVRVEKIILN